jgi:hypothetical protein
MDNHRSAEKLLKQLEFLFEKYSNEPRAMTQPYLLDRVIRLVPGYQYNPEDTLVREPLIEHVGSLPVVATAFYPYINNGAVNLGKALIMLAVHDIGELITHDEMSFTKTTSAKEPEHDAALSLIKSHQTSWSTSRQHLLHGCATSIFSVSTQHPKSSNSSDRRKGRIWSGIPL